MRQLQPVIWSKGTLVSPQYLQAQDRYVEDTLGFCVEALNFCPWGFQQLQIDRAALGRGYFAVSRASGILPDGLPFDIPFSDPPPPHIALAEYLGEGQTNLDLFLAIPPYRERSPNVSMADTGSATRYVAVASPVRDENISGSLQDQKSSQPKKVLFARKNFRCLPKGEAVQNSVAMRMASIERIESGAFRLSPRFVPPLLSISASEYVLSIVRRLIEILSARSNTLSGLRQQRNQRLADFGVSDIPNFWLLYTVNSHLPLLRHIFETRRGHPEDLFALMLSLAGSLTAFSSRVQPRDLPQYDHNELGSCLSALEERIRALLEEVPPNFVSLPLRLFSSGRYSTTLSDDRHLLNTKLYLALSAKMDPAEMIRMVQERKVVKVSSAPEIDTLIQQALDGVPLTHAAAPPIPIKLNYQYFAVDRTSNKWDSVERTRTFAVYVPDTFANPQLELIIVFPEAR